MRTRDSRALVDRITKPAAYVRVCEDDDMAIFTGAFTVVLSCKDGRSKCVCARRSIGTQKTILV